MMFKCQLVSMIWFILVIYDVQMSQLVSMLWFILVIYDVQMSVSIHVMVYFGNL